ncbi:hypothetical protein ACFLUO_09755 [Chloroflexota bacterium]
MARVMIVCPRTGKAVETGISMVKESFEHSTFKDNIIGNCPACTGRHVWSKEDAFLEDEPSAS